MYKVSINQTLLCTSTSLMQAIRELVQAVEPGDNVEIWQRRRTQWVMLDGCVWKELAVATPVTGITIRAEK